MADQEDDVTITSVNKSLTEQVRIRLIEYKGKPFIDVRIFYDAANGDWRPTSKGICLRPDLIHDVIIGMDLALKRHEEKTDV